MRASALLLVMLITLVSAARAETVLLMAEEPGCMWCARWNEEIAHIYPRTAEGRAAPLQRFDIRSGAPDGMTLDGSVRYTPTFILMHHGEEQGRIEGYPGEDFFWGLLGKLLERAQIEMPKSG